MQEQTANVVELKTPETLQTYHKLAIFLLGNLAAFGATMLVERGYMKGLSAYRSYELNSTK